MPTKKKKYNARFPAGRIKKIMQSDEEIGKVAQAVPVIIFSLLRFQYPPRTLELFVESLLTKTLKITNARNAKTLSPSHMKQCIMAENRFDFLRELVKNIPDISIAEEAASFNDEDGLSSPEEQYPDSDTPYDLSMPSTSTRALQRQQQQQQQQQPQHHHNQMQTQEEQLKQLLHNFSKNNNMSPQLFSAIHHYHQNQSQNGGSSTDSNDNSNSNTNASSHSNRILQRAVSCTMTSGTSSNNNDGINNSGSQLNHSSFRQLQQQHQSVIRHTATALASNITNSNEDGQLPAKIGRAESALLNRMPLDLHGHKEDAAECSRRRLKQQSRSLPTRSYNKTNNNNSNDINDYNIERLSLSKEKIEQQTPAAIPAPIVSFDYCNKPIVKIDYSNLQLPTKTTSSVNSLPSSMGPHSAPILHSAVTGGSGGSGGGGSGLFDSTSAFNFPTPVINIDLSNMVTTPAVALPTPAAVIDLDCDDRDQNGSSPATDSKVPTSPAITTISIGPEVLHPGIAVKAPTFNKTTTPTTATSSSDSKESTKSELHTKKPALVKQKAMSSHEVVNYHRYRIDSNKTSPGALANASKSASVSATPSAMTPLLTTSKTSTNLELDEDYDNI